MIKFIQIVVAVLVIVVGGYFIKNTPSAPKIDSSVVQGEGTVINTSIGELLGSADAKRCLVGSNDESGTTNGELFVSSNSLRGDFISSSATQAAVDSHLLIAGDSAYLWSSTSKEGIKFSLDSAKSGEASGIDFSAKKDYECFLWSEDPSKFELPTDTNFSDFAKLLEDAAKK
ncbi:MAG: hypothetical protein AAB682_02740 [Patescibacteria group bacterium]